jgi:hypothetical protein
MIDADRDRILEFHARGATISQIARAMRCGSHLVQLILENKHRARCRCCGRTAQIDEEKRTRWHSPSLGSVERCSCTGRRAMARDR